MGKVAGIRHGEVEYLLLNQIKRTQDIDELPFAKRWGFQDEKEYRLVYESRYDLRKFDIAIPLSCIDGGRVEASAPNQIWQSPKQVFTAIDRSVWSHVAPLKTRQSGPRNLIQL